MENNKQKRFGVLKTIYDRNTLGDLNNAISREEIYQLTVDIQNSGWKEFIEILDYLQQKKLIEFVYDDGLKPYFKITYQGIDEVEAALNKPDEATEHFPAQIFQNTFNAPVAGFQQAGQGNISNVIQNIGSDEVSLDNDILEKLKEFIDKLTTETPNDLSKSQAYQAAAILSELKESGKEKR